MNFEQLLESTIEEVEVPLTERNLSGNVDAFSRTNKFKAVTLPDGEVIVSVSNRDGDMGTIRIVPGNEVEYKDKFGNVVSKENRTAYGVTSSSLKNYYVPKLLNDTMTDDMFGNS